MDYKLKVIRASYKKMIGIEKDKYIFQFSDGYQVELNVGNQYFKIEPIYETQEEAEWMMRQLSTALDKLKTL